MFNRLLSKFAQKKFIFSSKVNFERSLMNDNGNAVAAWQIFNGSNDVIQAIPLIVSLKPSQGLTRGGNTVEIIGADFTTTTTGYFAETPANFIVNSDSSITVIVPFGIDGAANATIAATMGISDPSLNSFYTL